INHNLEGVPPVSATIFETSSRKGGHDAEKIHSHFRRRDRDSRSSARDRWRRLDPSSEGVIIADLIPGSPAQSYGFQRGDIVLQVNNQRITKTRDLERATSQQNRAWRITIKRGGQQISVVVGG